METESTKRRLIEDAAQALGARRAAVFKWRVRGIPASWKLKLLKIEASGFSDADLDDFAPPRSGSGANRDGEAA
jgi:hypothetical protein